MPVQLGGCFKCEEQTDIIGILWDSRTQLLHWVDIDNATVHT